MQTRAPSEKERDDNLPGKHRRAGGTAGPPGTGGRLLCPCWTSHPQRVCPSLHEQAVVAGVSCDMQKLLRKIMAGALQTAALFLTHWLTRKRRIKKYSSVCIQRRRRIKKQCLGPRGTWTSISAEGISTAGLMSWVSSWFASPISGPPGSGHLQKAPGALRPSTRSPAPGGASASGQRCPPSRGKLQLVLTQKLMAGRGTSFLTGPVQPSVPSY